MSAELEDIHEECGVFGVWGHQDAARLTYFGLHALQHRGQEGAGIVSNDNGKLHGYRGLGLLTQVFSNEQVMDRLTGNRAMVTCDMLLQVLEALITFSLSYSVSTMET